MSTASGHLFKLVGRLLAYGEPKRSEAEVADHPELPNHHDDLRYGDSFVDGRILTDFTPLGRSMVKRAVKRSGGVVVVKQVPPESVSSGDR